MKLYFWEYVKRNYRIKVEFRNFSKNEAYSEKPYELETVKFNL